MRGTVAEGKQLLRQAGALIKKISEMESEFPLKTVWGGLPRGDEAGRIIDEPPIYDEEEKQVIALREPLSQFLKDTKRFVINLGTTEQKLRFNENDLVEIAFANGSPGRRGYSKIDCLADLRYILYLLQGFATGADTPQHNPAKRKSSVIHLQSASDATLSQNDRVTNIGIEQHFSVRELSERWGLSERTVRRLIENEPDLIRIHKNSRFKRTYRRVQVPASVADRIYRKLTRRGS